MNTPLVISIVVSVVAVGLVFPISKSTFRRWGFGVLCAVVATGMLIELGVGAKYQFAPVGVGLGVGAVVGGIISIAYTHRERIHKIISELFTEEGKTATRVVIVALWGVTLVAIKKVLGVGE